MRELEVARTDWAAFFAALSALGSGAHATVEVLSGASGDTERSPARWVLQECRYDDGRDLLELTLKGADGASTELHCFVSEPRRIHARESQLERSIFVRDAAGVLTLVRLRRRSEASHLRAGLSSWRAEAPAPAGLRGRAGTRTSHTGQRRGGSCS